MEKICVAIRGHDRLRLRLSGQAGGTSNYDVLTNKPRINGVTLQGDLSSEDIGLIVDPQMSPTSTNPVQNKAVYEAIANAVEGLELEMPKILFGTTAYWDAQQIVSVENTIYIYTDLREDADGNNIAGIRVGDGSAYLSDLPFLDELYINHINDNTVHVTAEEKEFWNNKVRCYLSITDLETLVFTKD